ncbi:MAG: nickel-dependent lactate racemase [Lachnospiraceae bacterium]|nr:nickel-dependent lactate racemase [Lachnospiraceae bacterium]MBR5739473.1 nickel-dependent lactate racemase [Lachnospiraceae bacterium]
MRRIELPYGREKLTLEADEKRLRGVLVSHIEEYDPKKSGQELVEEAIAHPIGSAPLAELARGKRRITIIASDHTRPVPSKILMPVLLREIRKGNPDAEITILIATGCHRGTTKEELVGKFGEEIVRKERIYVHDCDETGKLVNLGTLPSGGECIVNRIATEADLLVSEGFIEPHFFAGFSGGRKSVLPGIAARETVLANHCSEFIADPGARAGSLKENPIHRDMIWAAKAAGLKFILNVVLNGKKEIIYAVAGGLEEAHEAGCRFLDGQCGVSPAPADIVFSTNGGYPLDQNIYQAVKGMTAAEATVKPGGVIVMLAKSNDGHGGAGFVEELTASDDVRELMRRFLERDRRHTVPDQWEAQILVRILQKARVIYVSDAEDALVRSLHMTPAHSIEEALRLAEGMVGKEASLTVIPDGIAVVVR